MAHALAVDWEQIKECAIAGMPMPEIAKQWGLVDYYGDPDTTAIRKRASREKWPIPSAVLCRAQKLMKRAKEAQREAKAFMPLIPAKPMAEGVTRSPVSRKQALTVLSDSAVTLGKRSMMAILGGAVPQIEQAMQRPEQFQPGNVKELVQLGSLIHKLSGLDKDAPEVKVNVAMFAGDRAEVAESSTWEAEIGDDDAK